MWVKVYGMGLWWGKPVWVRVGVNRKIENVKKMVQWRTGVRTGTWYGTAVDADGDRVKVDKEDLVGDWMTAFTIECGYIAIKTFPSWTP